MPPYTFELLDIYCDGGLFHARILRKETISGKTTIGILSRGSLELLQDNLLRTSIDVFETIKKINEFKKSLFEEGVS